MENNGKVYIVSRGEMSEGSSVIGVYSTKELAVAAALKERTYYDGGWQLAEDDQSCWTNGCDWVGISEQTVKTSL